VTRVAVFGGSFNPPHVAHVLTVAYLLACFDVDRVLVVPVFEHAFDKTLVPFDDRVRMCELALGWIPRVQVSRIESEIQRPSYTLRTLERLKRDHPDWQLSLVIGSDVLFETHKWHAFDEVKRLAPPIVLGRVGHPHPDAPPPVLPEVSSTSVREALARGDDVSALVPRGVLEHVRARGLYRS
jgi:nicotinate-nucleotide adenylyltransferase